MSQIPLSPNPGSQHRLRFRGTTRRVRGRERHHAPDEFQWILDSGALNDGMLDRSVLSLRHAQTESLGYLGVEPPWAEQTGGFVDGFPSTAADGLDTWIDNRWLVNGTIVAVRSEAREPIDRIDLDQGCRAKTGCIVGS